MGQRIARHLMFSGVKQYHQRSHQVAINKWQRALRRLKDDEDRFITLGYLAQAFCDLCDFGQMLHYALLQMELANSRQDDVMKSEAFLNLSKAYEKLSDFPKAISYGKASLQHSSMDPRTPGYANLSIAISYISSSQFQSALNSFEQAMNVANQTCDKLLELQVCIGLGSLFTILKDIGKALLFLQNSLQILQSITVDHLHAKYKCVILYHLSVVLKIKGNLVDAKEACEEGLRLASETNNRAIYGRCLCSMADIYRELGETEAMETITKSWARYEAAFRLMNKINDRMGEVLVLSSMAKSASENKSHYTGQCECQAIQLNRKCLEITKAIGCKHAMMKCHLRLQELYQQLADEDSEEICKKSATALIQEMELFCNFCGQRYGTTDESLRALRCSHIFHEKCLHLFLSQQPEQNCPKCHSKAILSDNISIQRNLEAAAITAEIKNNYNLSQFMKQKRSNGVLDDTAVNFGSNKPIKPLPPVRSHHQILDELPPVPNDLLFNCKAHTLPETSKFSLSSTQHVPPHCMAKKYYEPEVVTNTITTNSACFDYGSARKYGISIGDLPECVVFLNSTNNDTSILLPKADDDEEEKKELFSLVESILGAPEETKTVEQITKTSRLEELKMDPKLLENYTSIIINFERICHNYGDFYWFNTTEDANNLKINNDSIICDPYKLELQPSEDTMKDFETKLNKIVLNYILKTDLFNYGFKRGNITTIGKLKEELGEKDENMGVIIEKLHEALRLNKLIRRKREIESSKGETKAEESNLEPVIDLDDKDDDRWIEKIKKETNKIDEEREVWVEINNIGNANSILKMYSPIAAAALNLSIDDELFEKHKEVVLYLTGICEPFHPLITEEASSEGVDSDQSIGVNITALIENGVDLSELAKTLKDDVAVDQILTRTHLINKTLGGSYVKPLLVKSYYDLYSAPIVFPGSAVEVRFGIYIESMSNFQTTTMDYDMDIYLIMAWRDIRLKNNYSSPILVKEEDILEQLWRPDPFFSNAKEAEYHEVTFLNFLMRIFSDGLILYETRIKLKPACNLVLCKYPHDQQICDLKIKSFAYPVSTVRFEWFSEKQNAVDKNPEVKLPELYIDKYEPVLCNKTRKSGNFSCLRAVFLLKRDVGYHIAQTYVPTSLALMFSWVGVWLPEEFMEGRIGVAITVLLTLSTESAGAREHLPSVSYLKAIDLWFGYITGFVFVTLLQTLVVIGFEKKANNLRKDVRKREKSLNFDEAEQLLKKAQYYHRLARMSDNVCRVFYPVTFILFLMMYFFIYTEGRQDDCLTR
uniref:RING-type domain-containing protein n=1 Tax=Rhabditophanes sp. KR3021 TaxID=114890 RepID=A0AC35TLJ4_9BILA